VLESLMQFADGRLVDQIAVEHQTDRNLMGQGEGQGPPARMPVQIEGDPWPQGQAVLQGFIPFAGVVPLQGLGLIGHAEVAE
jgi:hypothetical protein